MTFFSVPSKFLLFASRESIRVISMDTGDTSDVMLSIPDLHNAVALDFHHKQQRVYYTDVYLREIR